MTQVTGYKEHNTKNIMIMKVNVRQTSRSTFNSYEPYVTTTEELIEGGWDIDAGHIFLLKHNETAVLYSPNGMTKITLTKV